MTKAFIPILNVEGKKVADFEWTGRLVEGSGKFKTTEGNEDVLKKIEAIIESEQNLKKVKFHSEGFDRPYVMGWEGFEGYQNCLELVLSSVGLRIDYDNIVYPPKSEYSGNLYNEGVII